MITYENQCVGCPPEMGCLGSSCPNIRVPVCTCDNCGDELDPDELYDYDGEMLCEACLVSNFKTVAFVGLSHYEN